MPGDLRVGSFCFWGRSASPDSQRTTQIQRYKSGNFLEKKVFDADFPMVRLKVL
jgi:hypothetical protein